MFYKNKRITCLEFIVIIDLYAPNNRALKYLKQTLSELNREIDNSAIIVGAFNTSLSVVDNTTRQKIKKEIEDSHKIVS